MARCRRNPSVELLVDRIESRNGRAHILVAYRSGALLACGLRIGWLHRALLLRHLEVALDARDGDVVVIAALAWITVAFCAAWLALATLVARLRGLDSHHFA